MFHIPRKIWRGESCAIVSEEFQTLVGGVPELGHWFSGVILLLSGHVAIFRRHFLIVKNERDTLCILCVERPVVLAKHLTM